MKIKRRDLIVNLWILAIILAYSFFPDNPEYSKAIAPLLVAAGASLLGGLFGKRKPKLSAEQEIAKRQYLGYINNPGPTAAEQQQLQQQMGAELGLQSALQNERLAGQGDTAFADAQRSQLAQAYANATSQGLTGLQIAGQNRAFQAAQALGGLQPTEMSKGNAFDVIGDVANTVLPVFANKYAKSSSIDFKENIAGTDPEAARQVLEGLDVKSFNYKPGIEDGGAQRQVGLIAENTPQPIATPDHRGVDISQLVMTMLSAMQSLSREIELVRRFAGSVKDIRKVERAYTAQ